jgi:hypothetical protein
MMGIFIKELFLLKNTATASEKGTLIMWSELIIPSDKE